METGIKLGLIKTKEAARELVNITDAQINAVLLDLADTIINSSAEIISANKKDLERMDKNDPKYDRLLLNEERIKGISEDMKNITALSSPLGIELMHTKRDSGLDIRKITVPLGVVGIVYEARPNVTFDVFSLCFKSGNACVLKGGSDAKDSNEVGVQIIQKTLKKHGINENIIFLAPAEREAVGEILEAVGIIDIIIPRGSQGLINFVRENSKVPTIETGAGICHTYVESTADTNMAREIVYNAKTRRPSVCNALDTLLIDRFKISDLPQIVCELSIKDVEIYADQESFAALKGEYPDDLLKKATASDFGREWLSLKMSIGVVSDYKEAVEWVTKYSSKHSETIVTKSDIAKDYFLKNVDAACVYHNTSTAFTDGAQFGLGAEIGISTQKLHARGPMALSELTSYKWLIESAGLTRE